MPRRTRMNRRKSRSSRRSRSSRTRRNFMMFGGDPQICCRQCNHVARVSAGAAVCDRCGIYSWSNPSGFMLC